MKYLFLILTLAACNVATKEAVIDPSTKVVSPSGQIITVADLPPPTCLMNFCDPRLIHIGFKYFLQPVDLYAIACASQRHFSEDMTVETNQMLADIISNYYSVTQNTDFVPEFEQDFGRADRISAPFNTDFLIAIDSVSATFVENMQDQTFDDMDDQEYGWGSRSYITGSPEMLRDLMGFNDPRCSL